MTSSTTLGHIVRLPVAKLLEFGAYLDAGQLGEVLLPRREVPGGCAVGDRLQVFLYKDSKDLIIATTQTPLASVGTCAHLKVVAVNDVGAFLDWGLPKDLFVPFSEQQRRLLLGHSYTVAVYLDNSGRIAASQRLHRFLSDTSDVHRPGQAVSLLIAGQTDLGYNAVVDDTHLGLLHQSEAYKPVAVGERLPGFVKAVRPDGKLDLCLRLENALSDDDLGERILEHLRARGGRSPLTDKSSPDLIYHAFGASKKAFKRALGGLYRRKLVELDADEVRLVRGDERGT